MHGEDCGRERRDKGEGTAGGGQSIEQPQQRRVRDSRGIRVEGTQAKRMERWCRRALDRDVAPWGAVSTKRRSVDVLL